VPGIGRATVHTLGDRLSVTGDVPPPSVPGVNLVQGRVLYEMPDGSWVDQEFDADKDEVVAIQFASEAYFTFLRLYPDARAFAQQGNEVTFFFNGRFVQISTEGAETMTEAALRKLFG